MPDPNQLDPLTASTRSVQVGGLNRAEILRELETHAVALNAYGDTLFQELRFEDFPTAEQRQAVVLTAGQLGFQQAAFYAEILARAATLGLAVCPLEAAPYLRLQYLDQPPDGTHITIASAIRDQTPSGFYLRRHPDQLWLRGYVASADYEWVLEERFIFLTGKE